MIGLAVDAGGTSTRCVVVDQAGRCLGYGRGGPGNAVSAGVAVAAQSVADAVAGALGSAGVAARRVDAWLVAVAGGVPADQVAAYSAPARALGLTAALVAEPDALAAFRSGTLAADGLVLIVGTGAVAVRIERGEPTAITDGLGWLLGDEGSGFWIGQRVVRAALAALDDRGPATALTSLVTGHLAGASSGTERARPGRPPWVTTAIDTLYDRRPVELARFAPLAFQVAGDAIADGIVADAAAALRTTLGTALAGAPPGPVVLSGGVFTHNPGFVERITAGLRVADRVRVVPDGVVGAAVLTLQAAGCTVDDAVHARIGETLAGVRGAVAP